MADRVGVDARRHEYVVAAQVDVEPARVVRPEVERAAGHEVEARVVPVAGNEARLDGALVQGEAEMVTLFTTVLGSSPEYTGGVYVWWHV